MNADSGHTRSLADSSLLRCDLEDDMDFSLRRAWFFADTGPPKEKLARLSRGGQSPRCIGIRRLRHGLCGTRRQLVSIL